MLINTRTSALAYYFILQQSRISDQFVNIDLKNTRLYFLPRRVSPNSKLIDLRKTKWNSSATVLFTTRVLPETFKLYLYINWDRKSSTE